MMYEGKHIHFSPVDSRPLCSYSGKLCRQRRVNGYAFCIRHILEDKTAPFKQCAHVAKYNNQKCTNPIPSTENREFCNSHMQVAGMAPKKERKNKKDKEGTAVTSVDGKLKFAERVKVLLKNDGSASPENFNNADDPYTFSDATLECATTVGKLTNVTASLPNAMEYSKEQAVEVSTKSDSPRPNCVSDKTKGTTIRSPKNVKRLEVKIARNKILDKLKKSRPSEAPNACGNQPYNMMAPEENFCDGIGSSTTASPTRELISTPSSSPKPPTMPESGRTFLIESQTSLSSVSKVEDSAPVNLKTANAYHIFPTRRPKLWKWREPQTVSDSLRTLQRIWEDDRDLKANIFPLGLEGANSGNEDSSDDETYQKHWLTMPGDEDSWLDEQNGILLRPMKLNFGKSELRRQCSQLRKAHCISLPERRIECHMAQALVKASRLQPLKTTRLLCALKSENDPQNKAKKTQRMTSSIQNCCYSNEDTKCSKIALPYTRHCIKHIMYNVDQLLFEHCTAKFADNTQCCVPVFDICHELPLCTEHARKRDNYSKMLAEPKPKKPRKKTKPSALTRPPKRGKKKKRISGLRLSDMTSCHNSSSQDMASLHFGMDSPGMSPNSPALNTDVTSELDSSMENELGPELDGPLSPGTIDKSLELPIDAAELANQASRLLDEHDFTEVLNKIPVEAFREIFNESKNGDINLSREESEFEQVLAAVNKDVKSLAKMSSDGQLDMNDPLLQSDHLSATIESTLSDLTGSGIGMDSLHVITSSLTTSDLNSISQVLSSFSSDGSLPNLPILSDIVTSSSQHPTDMVAGGFAVGSHPLLTGRHDMAVDQYECEPVDMPSTAYWLSEQLSMPIGQNGLISPTYGHSTSSKCVSHSLTNISKLETKGRNHINFNTSLLETSLNLGTMAPLVMELTENSTESVS